jgi:hypothetical protein
VIVGAIGASYGRAIASFPKLELGGRADFLVERLQLSHLDKDDTDALRQSRWLAGADALFEACWMISPGAGLFGAVGAEFTFGSTEIYLSNTQVGSVSALKGVGEFGLRARF